MTGETPYHWFTGDGMIHGIRLEEGKADWYRNRLVTTNGAPNTHVIGHGDRTWAIVESGSPPAELSYELETIGNSPDWGS